MEHLDSLDPWYGLRDLCRGHSRPHGHHGSGPDRSLELLPPGQRRAGLDHRSQLHRDLRWGHTGDLFAHPGTPASAAATLDGYQMARQGKGYRALCLISGVPASAVSLASAC